jgi:3-isopropylmalate/(R)-2-methylmalate dehydratase small subunit
MPISRSDINTDEIIPAKYLTEITKEALKPYILEDLKLSGFDRKSETFKKNQGYCYKTEFRMRFIARACPALEVNGITAIIAQNYARIFRQNMFNCGMIAIE